MTTTVKRGANRPAALARTRKAAQRTPLPGDLDALTVAQLRAEARRRGLSTTTKLTKKAELVRALSNPPAKPARQMGTLAAEAAKAPKPGEAKAAAFAAYCGEWGWDAKTSKRSNAVKVTGTYLGMVIVAQWTDGCWDYGASGFTRADGRTVKVLNVSAARDLVSLPRGLVDDRVAS